MGSNCWAQSALPEGGGPHHCLPDRVGRVGVHPSSSPPALTAVLPLLH